MQQAIDLPAGRLSIAVCLRTAHRLAWPPATAGMLAAASCTDLLGPHASQACSGCACLQGHLLCHRGRGRPVAGGLAPGRVPRLARPSTGAGWGHSPAARQAPGGLPAVSHDAVTRGLRAAGACLSRVCRAHGQAACPSLSALLRAPCLRSLPDWPPAQLQLTGPLLSSTILLSARPQGPLMPPACVQPVAAGRQQGALSLQQISGRGRTSPAGNACADTQLKLARCRCPQGHALPVCGGAAQGRPAPGRAAPAAVWRAQQRPDDAPGMHSAADPPGNGPLRARLCPGKARLLPCPPGWIGFRLVQPHGGA